MGVAARASHEPGRIAGALWYTHRWPSGPGRLARVSLGSHRLSLAHHRSRTLVLTLRDLGDAENAVQPVDQVLPGQIVANERDGRHDWQHRNDQVRHREIKQAGGKHAQRREQKWKHHSMN